MSDTFPVAAWQMLEDAALFPAAGMLAPWAKAEAQLSRRGHLLAMANGKPVGAFRASLRGHVIRPVKTALTFSGLPLIADAGALEQLFIQTGAAAVHFRAIPAVGPFWDSLNALGSSRLKVLHTWERAALSTQGDFADWFEQGFERKRRKEYRRLRTRLGETGTLESLALVPGIDPTPWTRELLDLEARGWKGARGTALAASPKTAALLAQALKELAEQGHLRFWKLALDGRPLAMMFALVHGSQAWLGKIAHDENFAKFSPGVLLVLDATAALFADQMIHHVDSCAIPDHPMINHVWRERLPLADVLVAGPNASPVRFGALVAWERCKIAARAKARAAYYTVTKRRQS